MHGLPGRDLENCIPDLQKLFNNYYGKNEPITAIQRGNSGGRFKAKIKPVTAALRSLIVLSLFNALRIKNSLPTLDITVTAISRAALAEEIDSCKGCGN